MLPRKESRRRSRLLPTRIDAHAAYWRKLLASFHRQSNSVDPTRISCSSIFAEWQDVEPTKSRFRQAQSIHSSYRLQHVRLLRQLKLYAHRCFEPDQKINIRVAAHRHAESMKKSRITSKASSHQSIPIDQPAQPTKHTTLPFRAPTCHRSRADNSIGQT